MQARILPLLGPAAVLYLIADVASAQRGLDASGAAIAAVAILASLMPVVVRRQAADELGALRVALLCTALGASLAGSVGPAPAPLPVTLISVLALVAAAALTLDLAASVPDAPRALDRPLLLRALPAFLTLVVGLMSAVATLSGARLLSMTALARVAWLASPRALALIAVLLAVALRLLRRRMGSTPEALASNAWALLGLLGAAVAGGALFLFEAVGHVPVGGTPSRGLLACAVASMVLGHVAMVDRRRRLAAGPATRRLVSLALTLMFVTSALAFLPVRSIGLEGAPSLQVVVALVGAVAVNGALRPAVRLLLCPFGGRLLNAVRSAERLLVLATHGDEVAGAVLVPMRQAARDPSAEPLLFMVDPGRAYRIGAAGEPQVCEQALPEPLASRVADRPGEVIVRAPLERLVVRRPELRALVDLLVSMDALCVVPLSVAREVEGALVVPRGGRRSGLSLEEIDRLQALGRRLSATVSMVSAQLRAQARVGRAETERKDLQEQLEHGQEELEGLRADARVLKAGRAAQRMTEPPVAYGPAMRALVSLADEVAPLDAPVLLVAEAGSAIDRVGHRIHSRSGRKSGPFVIADCASVRADRAAAALFGESGVERQPGWLRLAAGGSLLLVDVPALPHEVQTRLAQAVAERQARALESAGSYVVDVRIIATSRVPLAPLVDAGAFCPELGRWLSGLTLRVPPLRERTEDLPSLVLLSLDRACRVLGRGPVGIEQGAMDLLLAQGWPGNLRELQWAIDQAVSSARGVKVVEGDLPGFASARPRVEQDPLDGTYADLERRVLVHALEQADGNKSEAARRLALKRTTFLDKLRRHGLNEAGRKSTEESAA